MAASSRSRSSSPRRPFLELVFALSVSVSALGCVDETPVEEHVAATAQGLSATLYPVADTSITSLETTNSNGSNTYLYTGIDNLGTPGSHRALLRFDVSAFANATISAATLWMYMDKLPASATNDYQMLYRLTQTWYEGSTAGSTPHGLECSANGYGATWYSAWCNSSFYAWSTAGGPVVASYTDFVAPANTTAIGWKSWSAAAVAADVQGWATGSYANNGWVVRGWYEANGSGTKLSARRWSSREGTSPPQLSLTYTCNSGYTQSGNGCTYISNYCGAPASVANASYSVSGGVAGGSTYSLNAVAAYTCFGGYTKTGSDSTCQTSATWTAAPSCTVVSNYCGTPPTVANSGGAVVSGGAAGGSTNSVGATAAYTCSTGYSKSGSNSTCQSNGTWSAAPTCTAVVAWCAAPPTVTNAAAPVVSGGVAGGSTNSYLATAAYTCNTGYVKSGSNSQCGAAQTWSTAPTCSPVNCGSAPSVTNASVVVSGGAGGGSTTTYLATAAYTCNGGYSKTGSDATCLSSGSWSAAPSCGAVSNYCGAPPTVANASVVVSGGAAGGSTNSVNATAAYTCATGYSLSGSNSTCQSNGSWTTAPSCVVVASWCAAPPSNISNGNYALGAGLGGYTSSLNATATYSCSAGYSISGSNPSTCQANQTWSTAPSCNAISSYCPAVPSVANASAGTPTGGVAGGSTLSLNATVTYACNGGYSMSGTNPITCQSGGSWSTGPTCSVVSNYCGAPPTVTNGSLSGVSGGAAGGSTNSVGATASYACAVGYKFAATSSSTCQSNGSWSTAPSCIVDTAWCAAAPSVANAGVATLTGGLGGDGTTSYQATATYSCNGGYTGGGTSTCQSSQTWSASPSCAAVSNYCGAPPSVSNSSGVTVSGGAAGGSTNSVGASALYTCSAGYTLTGSAATCQSSGLWSTAPTCAPTANFCGAPPVVGNAGAAVVSGGAAGGSTNSLGATAAYSCNTGYLKSGSDATCQSNGSWSAAPSCAADVAWCSVAPSVTNATAPSVSGGIAGGATTSLNAVAAYTCNGGYAFAAGNSATCQASRSWSTTPVCNVVSNYCGAPPSVTNASGVTVSGGAAGGSSNSVGATATYSCNAGYSLSGSNPTCGTNGSWSAAPTCAPIAAYCSAAPSVTNASAPVVTGGAGGGSTTSVGATAAYACLVGYAKSGSDSVCQTNASWSATPTCSPVDCGAPPVVANSPLPLVSGGNGGGSTTTYGATAVYACGSGYSQSGANPTCQNDGSWSGTPSCDDVDECGSNPCGVGSCTNLVGSYTCTCPMGTHVFNNGTCEALNACNNGTANCLPMANCTSSDPINFVCSCPSGYTGDGITSCNDVDECATPAANDCDASNATCTNTVGSYVCGCAAGYSGDGVTVCSAINNYCGSAPTVPNAGVPSVSGGIAGGSTSSLGAMASYACGNGYAFVAGSTSVCQADANWSAAPVCAPIASYCGAPPSVTNASAPSVSGGIGGGSSTSMNAVAAVSCNAGYTKSGSDSVCLSNATWSAAPTCDPIGNFCGAPPSVANAGAPTVAGGAGGGSTYSLSATAAYTCNPGYAKNGSDSFCQSDASWSAAPTCDVVASFCPTAPTITHAAAPVVSGGAAGGVTTSYGATATYACDAGYAFSGGSTATCQADTTWSALPNCVAVASFCGAPPIVAHAAAPLVSGGAAGGSTASLGATAAYACSTGYSKSGADATCQSNGSWSAAPSCTEDPSWCAAPPVVANASAPAIAGGLAGGTTTSLDAVATYTCDVGYAFVGGSSSSCQSDRSWSTTPVCGVVASFCGAPPVVANALGTTVAGGIGGGSTNSLGAVATYVCSGGYELSGGVSSTCQPSATWSAPPACVPTVSYCGAPPTVANASAPTISGGIAGGSTDSLGAVAAYVCDPGFDLVGAAPSCQSNGSWSAAPVCVPRDCGMPPTVADAGVPSVSGGAGGGATTTYGASATYVCNSGYQLAGGAAVCLASGSWSAAPSCVDIDECATNNGGCGSATYITCVNNLGAAPTCIDIDECQSGNGGCGSPTLLTCVNNVAAAPTCADVDECATNNGGCGDPTYFLCTNNYGAVATCADVDECATNNGGCGAPGLVSCVNNVGGAPTCVDIDECTTNNGGCGDPTYFTCTNNLVAPPTCADIDECAVGNGGCGDAAYYACVNNVGAVPTCSDIDECATNNGGCGNPTYFACANVVGGAPTCSDIDECATNNGGCGDPTYFACVNVVGGAPTCSDIDECATNNGGCGAAGVYSCTNNVGAPPTCGDVDDCSPNPCTAGATCTDHVGSFTCTCPTGYTGDGVTSCVDVDECALGTDDCAPTASCSNQPGTFVCSCPVGFQGTGKVCADIDECATNNGGCAANEVCMNRVGMPPVCQCMAGTTADGGSACAVLCGDGVRGLGEQCDDANTVDGDGCSSACRIEPGYACYEPTDTVSTCTATCGNGLIDPPAEECDDATSNSATAVDACRPDCKLAHCGDSVVDTGEACDVGASNSDTAPNTCRTDCRNPFCGDGVIDSARNEVCDTGGGVVLADSVCTSNACPPVVPDGGMADGGTAPAGKGSCGCHVAESAGSERFADAVVVAFLFALVLRRRKRD